MGNSRSHLNGMSDVQGYIGRELGRFTDEILEFLRIPSVSAKSEHNPDTRQAAEWLRDRMEGAGLEAEEAMDLVRTSNDLIAERIEKATPPAPFTHGDLIEASKLIHAYSERMEAYGAWMFRARELANRLADAGHADPTP